MAKKTLAVQTQLTRTITFILEIPIVRKRRSAITRRNVWDGLMVLVGIIIFHLFFNLDFIEGSGAEQARKTHRNRVPLVSGYVFTRCLGGGSRGSGGKSS